MVPSSLQSTGQPLENSLPPPPTSRVLRLGATVPVLWDLLYFPMSCDPTLNPLLRLLLSSSVDTAHISTYSLESLFLGCLGYSTLVFSTAVLGAPPSPCLVPSVLHLLELNWRCRHKPTNFGLPSFLGCLKQCLSWFKWPVSGYLYVTVHMQLLACALQRAHLNSQLCQVGHSTGMF